jgi:hypothetical protein
LSRTGSFGWSVATGDIIWSDETFTIFGYDKTRPVAIDVLVQRTHPTIVRPCNRPSTERSETDRTSIVNIDCCCRTAR